MIYRDPWVILGVGREADDAAIKKAYRKLARELHPDRNKDDPEAEARFQDVAEAYGAIHDQAARANWLVEHEGRAAFTGEFGATPHFSSHGDAREGIQEIMEVSFREAFSGANRQITLNVEEACVVCGGSGAAPGQKPQQCGICRGSGSVAVGDVVSTCERCGGTGYVIEFPCPRCEGGLVRRDRTFILPIPPGVRDGQALRLTGSRADIIITIRVAPSAVFRRTLKDPADLLIVVPITYTEACFGAAVRIPTPDKVIQLRIPAGTQAGKAFRIPGKGMPKVGGGGVRGDLYARIQIVVPNKLTKPQRELIQQLRHYDSDDLRASLFAALRGDVA